MMPGSPDQYSEVHSDDNINNYNKDGISSTIIPMIKTNSSKNNSNADAVEGEVEGEVKWEKCCRIDRDYSKADQIIQFKYFCNDNIHSTTAANSNNINRELMMRCCGTCMQGRMDAGVFGEFISELNRMYADAESINCKNGNVADCIMSLLTCHLWLLKPSHLSQRLSEIERFIDERNKMGFEPVGLRIVKPSLSKHLYLDVERRHNLKHPPLPHPTAAASVTQ